MTLLTSILLLLVVSRVFGEIMARLKQPAIIGEILSGILLGTSILNLVHPTEPLAGIAELSVFLIVLSAGMEMDFRQVIRSLLGKGIVVALLGFFIPLAAGTLLGFLFKMEPLKALFLGLCISITALPVAVRILETFKMLDSRISRYSIAAAIVNDVAALLLLGVALDRPVSGGFLSVVRTLTISASKLMVFALVVFIVSRLLQWAAQRTEALDHFFDSLVNLFGREALFAMVVLFVLAFGAVSESLGSHFVIGTFFGGLLLSKDFFGAKRFAELENVINSITGGFLAPIFFAFLGLQFSVSAFRKPIFILLVLIVAMVSKIYAGVLSGKLLRLGPVESLGIGIILNGRGVMELVVANIALQRGVIDSDTFSVLVLMGIVTTLMTPILFRKFALRPTAAHRF